MTSKCFFSDKIVVIRAIVRNLNVYLLYDVVYEKKFLVVIGECEKFQSHLGTLMNKHDLV